MSFEQIMQRMLPPQNGVSPHVTGEYGEDRANGPHGGVDFNYVGGQSGINMEYPTVYAPISGEVYFSGGNYGTVKIRDAEGYSHEILHLNERSVTAPSRVNAGDPIGTMGGRGPNGATQYARHVHYQMKDSSSQRVNPQQWWDDRPVADTPQASSWAYPFQDKEGNEVVDPAPYYEALGLAESGFYPVGANGVWHGGIHFDRGTGRKLAQDAGVRCIADGEVIAYRIDSEYPVTDYTRGPAAYSTGFVLVKHVLQLPPSPNNAASGAADNSAPAMPPPVDAAVAGAPNFSDDPIADLIRNNYQVPSEQPANDAPEGVEGEAAEEEESGEPALTFYSLYMHFQDWARYQSDQDDKPRPAYWTSDGTKWVVAEKAVDANPYGSVDDGNGIRVRQGNSSRTSCIGWLPPGAELTVEQGEGAWRKIVSIDQGAMVADPVHAPSADAPAGWIYTGELDPASVEPSTFDAVHVLDEPVKVSAGELMGYLGQYKRYRDTSPFTADRSMVHVEAFSGDDVEDFIRQSRARAGELPDDQKTLLLVEEGAQLALPAEPDLSLSATESAAVVEGMDGDSQWVQVRKGRLETVPRSGLGNYDVTNRTYGQGSRVLHRILDEAGNEISLEDFNALGAGGGVHTRTAKSWCRVMNLFGSSVPNSEGVRC